ncbi:cytochrome b5 domain-containing protein [Clostridium perfringens]|uniref:cytochrome b5 domain-containing protein n=1 Tax=Clostridium perfringens TaxID=1502 RepID=UPI000E1511C2|nr:cytochrome b5 domain-containing protein [Clostridium perfringens]SUY31939.1 heme/steroid binding domain-containing protein [Clostridium perfringens]HBI6896858.1 hypothetical protein [Clostridium perfringens]HBI6917697.1 hypothetical protein [Clostridium perfringens]HBI7037589.1 hypothetical protein [Clostridium perfringens]
MCNFFEEKFEQINKLKHLMTLYKGNNQDKIYKEQIEDIFKEFQRDYIREESNNMLILTKEELANFNGENGNPAYISIDGIIYDISNIELLKQSPYNSLKLGSDVTETFYELNDGDESILRDIPMVGLLAEPEEAEIMDGVEEYYPQQKLKIMSSEELKKYNGENGRLAYVAIEGIVYDITNLSGLELFSGTNLRLGSDITEEFKTYYRGDKELLKDAKEVAILHDFNESQRGKHIEHNLKELTLNELSKYNGEKGKPPYISIFDTIYDLSYVDKWQEKNIKVGCDLTGEYKEVYGNDKSHLKN